MKRMWKLAAITGTVIVAGLAQIAWAEKKEKISVLDTIIVTDSVKQTKLVDTPSAITVLTAEEIRNSGQARLADLISSIPGVINQKSGSKTYFSIRGTRGTLSPGAVIYVDGRPINTGLNRYSKIDTIPLDNVEKIEVIKSPSPAIYGANASRGVILITTGSGKGAEKPLQTNLCAEYGSWNTAKGTATLSGTKNNIYYSLTGHAMQTDGYRESDEEVANIDGKLGYRFDGGFIDLVAGHNDSFTRYPKGLNPETAEKDPRSPGYVNDDGYFVLPNETDEEMTSTGLKFNYDKNDWLLNASLIYTRDKQAYLRLEDQNSPDINDRQEDYKDDREENRYDVKIGAGRTMGTDDGAIFDTLTVGFDYTQSDFDQVRSYPFTTDALTSSMISDKHKADIDLSQNICAFNANNDFNLGDFRLLTGARLNHVKYEIENKVPASVEKTYNGDLDWNVAPSYAVIADGNLFVSYNHSHYYMPLGHYKLDMQYNHAEARAEDLEPERYDTWEAGFKHRLCKAFNYSVILYHTTVEDKVVSFYDGTRLRGYRNSGTSIHRGIEVEVDGRPRQWFGYRLTLTTIDAEWDEGTARAYADPDAAGRTEIDLAGKKVHTVPEYEYSVGFDFFLLRQTAWGSLTASVDIHGFGEQYEDYNNNFKMGAADFVDLKLTWAFGRYELYLNSTNIFDKQWDKYVNTTGKNHSDLGGMSGIYPQDGRYIGIGGSVCF